MLYWINKKNKKNNVVILGKNAIVIASCDIDSYDRVDRLLKNNTSPVSVFGKQNLIVIPLAKVSRHISQVKDPGIEISVQTTQGTKKIILSFDDFNARESCFQSLKQLRVKNTVAPSLNKKVNTDSSLAIEPKMKSNFTNKRKPDRRTSDRRQADRRAGGGRRADRRSPIRLTPKHQDLGSSSHPNNINYETVKNSPYRNLFIGIAAALCLVVSYFLFFAGAGPASLYEAIQTNQLKSTEIESYLNDGANIDYRGEDGITPLLSAINHRKEDLITTLVDKGANLADDYNGETALDIAIASGLEKAVTSMLDKNAPSSNRNDLLTRAIQNRLSVDVLNKIIMLGGNVNYVNDNGSSVLATALLFGSEDQVIKLLLDHGASTAIKINGVPPVVFVQSRGNQRLVEMLNAYKQN